MAWSTEPEKTAENAASPAIALAPEDGLLILQSGEVIQGKITLSGNRYYVALPNGELRIRTEDVSIRCRDLRDGYEKQRAALAGNRAEEHLQLAQWCIAHALFDAAEREIRQATSIDPRHPKLRLIKQRLELALAEPAKTAPVTVPRQEDADAANLDRLAKETPTDVMRGFTTSVQPLLLNSCATGNCHGVGTKSDFTLTRLRGHGERARRQTLRNLLAVLGQLDAKSIEDSPLLTQPIAAHGGGKSAVFTERNSRQYYELFQWARLASGERNTSETSPSGESAAGGVLPVQHEEPVGEDVEADVDPVDPEEFNREFGERP